MQARESEAAGLRQLKKERSQVQKRAMAKYMVAFILAVAVLVGASAAQHSWSAPSSTHTCLESSVFYDLDCLIRRHCLHWHVNTPNCPAFLDNGNETLFPRLPLCFRAVSAADNKRQPKLASLDGDRGRKMTGSDVTGASTKARSPKSLRPYVRRDKIIGVAPGQLLFVSFCVRLLWKLFTSQRIPRP